MTTRPRLPALISDLTSVRPAEGCTIPDESETASPRPACRAGWPGPVR